MNFTHEANRIFYKDDSGKLLAEVLFPAADSGTVGIVEITRTFVDDSLRGKGVADKLLGAAYNDIKAQNKKAEATCSYAVKWFEKHEDKRDILA